MTEEVIFLQYETELRITGLQNALKSSGQKTFLYFDENLNFLKAQKNSTEDFQKPIDLYFLDLHLTVIVRKPFSVFVGVCITFDFGCIITTLSLVDTCENSQSTKNTQNSRNMKRSPDNLR